MGPNTGNTDTKMATINTRNSKSREEGGGAGVEKLPIGYCVRGLDNGIIRSPNLRIRQYTPVTKLHMYPLNLKLKIYKYTK